LAISGANQAKTIGRNHMNENTMKPNGLNNKDQKKPAWNSSSDKNSGNLKRPENESEDEKVLKPDSSEIANPNKTEHSNDKKRYNPPETTRHQDANPDTFA
jgi:hypothetical protein